MLLPSKTDDPFRLDAKKYIRQCLSKVVPMILQHKAIFQQDGARAHMNRQVFGYLNRKGVEFIEKWPASCPDLNSIEAVWYELKTRIGAKCPLTADELKVAAEAAWSEIPQRIIDAHVLAFRGRLVEIVRSASTRSR